MTTATKYTCNRCDASAIGEPGRKWPRFTIHGDGYIAPFHVAGSDLRADAEAFHLCASCVIALAAFMPQIRPALGRFVTYADTIEIRSDVRILPTQSVQLGLEGQEYGQNVGSQSAAAFNVCRIVIEGDPSAWNIDDILIGNRSQFMRPGIPGDTLSWRSPRDALDYDMGLEQVRLGMALIILATYVGNNPEGMPFGCTLHRAVVGFDPKLDPAKPSKTT